MPSPNIPNYETALLYVGTCLFEGTNVSEGRGTAAPFAVIENSISMMPRRWRRLS